MAVTRPLTRARAEELLAQVAANPPYTSVFDGTSHAYVPSWDYAAIHAWTVTRRMLPADVDADLLHRALVAAAGPGSWRDAAELPAHHDDAIVRLGEHLEDTQVAWKFIMVALRTGRGERHPRLRRLLAHDRWLGWAGQRTRAQLVALIEAQPEIVEAARIAFPLETDAASLSRLVPLLAADGAPDSLDLLLPGLEAAREEAAHALDWYRTRVAPLFPDTAHCRAFVAGFADATHARAEASPARAWLRELGQADPPVVVQFELSYKDARGRGTCTVRAASDTATWLMVKRGRTRWQPISPGNLAGYLPPTSTHVIVRCGDGVDRALVQAWARAQIAASLPT